MQIPQVTANDVKNFSKVWKYKGLSMILTDMHIQFATDFVNLSLRQFVQQVAAQQMAAAQAAAAKKIVVAQ